MDPPVQNTVREQSDPFTVQCCHWDSNGRWIPCSMCKTLQNTRAQSDLFTVQCCHWDSKADGPSSQHCQSTELSLHCSMLSLRLKGRWTSPVRAQSDLFTVQCCHSDSNLTSSRAEQSDLFTVQCCHWDSNPDGPPPVNTVKAQSDLFTVQCCHSDSKADEPPSQHCQSTEWLLHCSMLPLRLKGRWTPTWSTLSEHRVISSLFNVVIQTPKSKSEWTSPIETQRHGPPVNTVRAQSYLFTVQCCHWDSKADGPPLVKTVRAQSDLFTVQCWPPMWKTLPEHRDCSRLSLRLKDRWTPQNTVRAQSYLFTLQCCHSDSKADGPPWSTLSEHRVISSLFNVVIQTQRQMDPPVQHCQSTEWSLHCSMLSFRLKGRWTPQSTLSEPELHWSMLSIRLKGR